ncbi:hypothetical protein CD149_03525 [Staphylococcus condimenti]|uniref:Uncharacterized protein n=2 Tax=Staphylococcus condimenti TaxID=70255 RepID=A0A4Q7CJE7_9STAP|nr:hypothetical protein CD149_03525 [Staphylococcus condimenti]RZI00166.1 hypothetical protein EIG99_12330 [Staphylococcus condimenti]RZI04517.1 hypothetical protein EIG98_04095 [Staphylococcus condimenti]
MRRMRNIFLIVMIILNIIAICITLSVQPGVSYLSLRVIFVGFSTIISFYLMLLRKTRTDLLFSIGLFVVALIHVSVIASEVYHYIY